MPLSNCLYAAIPKYRWRQHCQNLFPELTLTGVHKMHPRITEMYYTLYNGFRKLLNVDCLPPRFKLD